MHQVIECPVCKSLDHCGFVFEYHYDPEDETDRNINPGDIHNIYICPMLHVFTKDGIIKPHDQQQTDNL